MKKTMQKTGLLICVSVAILALTACMKDFLDVKRDKSQVIPKTVEDYRSIFEQQNMNVLSSYQLGLIGSDDYFVDLQQWQSLSNPIHKNGYIWAEEVYQGQTSDDWNKAFERILFANFVLEGVGQISETSGNRLFRNEVLGAAHFFRGTNFFQLAQLFCRQYDAETAKTELGLPLRTTSNINAKFQRSTVEDTYLQIISDLEAAAELLPNTVPLNTRPCRPAALGMLANVYLIIGDYPKALAYADQALELASDIWDYNEVNTSLSYPFPLFGQGNIEILFNDMAAVPTVMNNSNMNVDSLLLASYNLHDIRKKAFFFTNSSNGRQVFKGSYVGTSSLTFTGLTTAETLLIRAECNARVGNKLEAVADLNRLLVNRIERGYFEPVAIGISAADLLSLVLQERRKELVFRGRRWSDLKRFIKEGRLEQPLTRLLGEQEYVLPVGSSRWAWPIPPDVISLGGLAQNPR